MNKTGSTPVRRQRADGYIVKISGNYHFTEESERVTTASSKRPTKL
jgi:hypothetical protein